MPSLFSEPRRAKLFARPQSAVTGWIERICAAPDRQNSLTGFIIELVESINLQPTGPEEASRAIRKQLKHGRPTQQAHALTVLDALVLNGGDRFRDARLVDTLKSLTSDPRTDQILRRRLLLTMEDWERAYGSDPKMTIPASLFKSCGGRAKLEKISSSSTSAKPKPSAPLRSLAAGIDRPPSLPEPSPPLSKAQLKMQTKQDKKRKEKLKSSHIDQRYRTELVLPAADSPLSEFDLTKESPRILQTLASASQSANNLVNRLQLIGADQLANDSSVARLAEKAKSSQKALIRCIQTVSEHDSEGEYLGTLLNTNAQLVTALALYSELNQPKPEGRQDDQLAERLDKAKITAPQSGTSSEPNLFDDLNYAVDHPDEHHPQSPADDLMGLDFSTTASLSGLQNLPAPLVPSPVGCAQASQPTYDPGTLSDYSSFDDSASSSDETTDETTVSTALSPPPSNHPFPQHLTPAGPKPPLSTHLAHNEPLDPFADPFADSGPTVANTHGNDTVVTSRVV